jgi:superfamily II DNA/RNA helicase
MGSATWSLEMRNLAAAVMRPGTLQITVGGAGHAAVSTVSQRVMKMTGKGAPRFRRLLEILQHADAEAEVSAALSGYISDEVPWWGTNAEAEALGVGEARTLVFALYKKEAKDVAAQLQVR